MGTQIVSAQSVFNEELRQFAARLKWREDDVRLAAAEALIIGEDKLVQNLIPVALELADIRAKIANQFAECQTPKFPAPSLSEQKPAITISCRRYGLRAILNGVKIESRTDASTFADTIQQIGCERVAALRLIANRCPLVSKDVQKPRYGRYRTRMQIERRNDWYIVTHCNTERKAAFLRGIKAQLNLDLVVETSWQPQ